ncbi:MAG: FkbM family methyltransferase [Opitutaceae bacterium]
MSNFIKNCRLRVASLANKFIVDQTKESQIRSLITSLHPIVYDKKLIRIGSPTDGGYLVPDDLEGIEHCFSPGVADASDLEYECAERGMGVFMADKSVDQPAVPHQRFHFTKKYIGVTTNDTFMTLDDWVATSVSDRESELFLQIDIEGFEYEVFLAASDQLMRRFRIIVAEFHRLDQFWGKPFFGVASRAIEKILQTHYCVHSHPNNWRGSVRKGDIDIPINMEFTFVRKDRVDDFTYAVDFPHPLDIDNVSSIPSLVLPPCWYRRNG